MDVYDNPMEALTTEGRVHCTEMMLLAWSRWISSTSLDLARSFAGGGRTWEVKLQQPSMQNPPEVVAVSSKIPGGVFYAYCGSRCVDPDYLAQTRGDFTIATAEALIACSKWLEANAHDLAEELCGDEWMPWSVAFMAGEEGLFVDGVTVVVNWTERCRIEAYH